MARHCREAHNMQTVFLKENRKPKWEPHRPDWQDQVTNPAMILVKVADDPEDSDISSIINSDENIEVGIEGFDLLDRTLE